MAEFTYTAITKEGKRETSTIQAPTAIAAAHSLKEQGLLPVKVEAVGGSGSFLNALKGMSTVSLDEKISFIENLSVMLKAGIPLSRCLQILVKQTNNYKFKKILADVSSMVQSGNSLGDALGKYPEVFSGIFVSMVRVGEMSGNLDKSLQYLTIQLQREADIKSKTRGAMIYPAVIVFAMLIVGVLLSIFVLPKLTSVFADFGTNLPVATRVVMAFANFMGGHAVIVIAALVILVTGIIMFLRTENGKRLSDITLLHFYIINDIIRKINLARFARILGSLLKSGIPIVESLEVTGDAIANSSYKELILQTAKDVKLGKPLTESLDNNPNLFPNIIIQMLEVGEESGTLETILEELAQHYEEEVDSTMKNLTSIIEPLLLLFIGGVVAVLAYALIVPIYSMGQNIS